MSRSSWTSRCTDVVPAPRRRDLAFHDLDGEAVVTHPVSNDTIHLNETARLVLGACDGRRTTRQIAESITARFDVDFDRAFDDVEELVLWLAESKLLRAGP